jgi:hypothetical protein
MFRDFSNLVHARYESMRAGELFVVDTTDLFETYLSAFPEGTNPIFRTNTEHDCSCCKNFIRNIGNVVAIQDGRIVTVWDDHEQAPAPYDVVGHILAERVRQAPIKSVWRSKERQYGAEKTNELLEDSTTRTWHHFHGKVAGQHFNATPDAARGELDTAAHVLRRGLEEIRLDDLDTIIDLAEANNLLRGAEMVPALKGFRVLKAGFTEADDKNLFVWANIADRAARFRNTAIGTLLTDLAEGTDLEVAVAKYENKVNGTNYKRPTALITPKMVDAAMAKIDELGLRGAVDRRHARIEDVSVNDVLFVDNAVAGKMKDSLADLLMDSVAAPAAKIDNPTPISAEDFFRTVVPKSQTISALVENRHAGNFMSITAPINPGDARLFNWDNDFSWSYDGDVADSIKQRVKAAGGNVDAKFRVSLAWFNTDDLDIHAQDPRGNRIYYGNKMGVLDVDMNVRAESTAPVENLSWTTVLDGVYRIAVNQFSKRNSTDVGFTIEVAFNGNVQQFHYARAIGLRDTVHAMDIIVQGGQIVDIRLGAGLTGGSISQDKWGIKTETLVPVDTLMLSPNHWNGAAVGNKHWFFILRGAKNPDPVRGIYNEYLRPDLHDHRKVFEVLGSKTKAPFADDQLSGLGFSSTQRATLTVVAKGADFNRAYQIQF